MSVVEVDALNSEKMFKLVYSQLSGGNRRVNTEQFKTRKLSKEQIQEIVNKEIPDIEEVMKDLNRIANSNILNKKVKLSVNRDINRVIIKIVDRDTDKVIKEIPCKELQQLAIHLKKAIGILFDENA